ncbi:hypothetical protein DWB77_01369 [Streptomyces hundungensis]|uniref:Uncharacterized protein n=2 Tax=Streptomyces hundungensis TaxID=1077946 RepID=A0A387HEZ3_9ACTN|nr:hypothetical protein DWB77_01369 [Streptomyces hundungensis]
MDAAPEARGASRPPETKVPSQAPNGPTGEGPSRPRGEAGAVEAPEPAAPEAAAPEPAASANPVAADAAAEAAAASDAAGSDEPVEPAVSAAPADAADGSDATRSHEPAKALEDTEPAASAPSAAPATPEHAERPTHPEGSEGSGVAQLPQSASELEGAGDQPERRRGMAPWQARRIRMVAAGVLMAAMGIILVVRLATQSSVLVVGVYGLALILCGVVIELSRNGRTRLGSWLLVAGLAAAFAMDWFVLP